MSVYELLPGVPLDRPQNQEPNGMAIVFAHGFGDTHEGPMATKLGHVLTQQGIAVARVPLAERIGENDVLPFPLSEQAERIANALQAAANEYSNVCIVGHSLGNLPAAEGALDCAVPGIPVTLLAPPPTNGRQRLEEEMSHCSVRSEAFAGRDLAGVISRPLIRRQIGLTPEFWEEIKDFEPLPLISAVFAKHPTRIVLSGEDERFSRDNEHLLRLPVSELSSVEVLPGANHHFSRHRRKVAEMLAAVLLRPQEIA